MDTPTPDYDPRYLAGVLFFNERDFFEAHEVWEDLWADCPGPERRFYQALIQAAVALYHFGNGNARGAVKLYRSSRDYMAPYGSPYQGLDVDGFWRAMEACFAPLLAHPDVTRAPEPDGSLMPVIRLEPPPAAWPDLAEFGLDED